MTPDICPQCGAVVPEHAKSCSECGSCEETGWSDNAQAGRLGIPEDSFDYEDYLKEEFGDESGRPKTSILWPVIAVVLVVLVILGFVW
jgi:uncharacterized membrane protein YvbJ